MQSLYDKYRSSKIEIQFSSGSDESRTKALYTIFQEYYPQHLKKMNTFQSLNDEQRKKFLFENFEDELFKNGEIYQRKIRMNVMKNGNQKFMNI